MTDLTDPVERFYRRWADLESPAPEIQPVGEAEPGHQKHHKYQRAKALWKEKHDVHRQG